jgi:hypothetical protein
MPVYLKLETMSQRVGIVDFEIGAAATLVLIHAQDAMVIFRKAVSSGSIRVPSIPFGFRPDILELLFRICFVNLNHFNVRTVHCHVRVCF